MAHELEIRNGEASMFYVQEPPWHGLGKRLERPATAAEAIQAAHLGWGVKKVALFAHEGNIRMPVPDRFGIVRDDLWGKEEGAVLGIVGRQYTPLQNIEAFSFFDEIVGQGEAVYHTAGALGGGERVWILAQLPKECIRVTEEDVVEKYLLLSNSHDGSSSVQVKFTPIRVVCQNTLTMALSKGPSVRVQHTRSLFGRLDKAQSMLGLIKKRYEAIGQDFVRLSKVKMNPTLLEEYWSRVFPLPADSENQSATRKANEQRFWATHFYHEGKGNSAPAVRETLWAAYNGVTELVDHRGMKRGDDALLESMWFGDGYLLKARAFEAARQMAEKAA